MPADAKDDGKPGTSGELLPEVYDELRKLARARLTRERHSNQTLQPTALVHEAYLRLARDAPAKFQNRAHFIAIAAISMRRLLVERARARGAAKRGGAGQVQVTLDDRLLAGDDPHHMVDLIALDSALTELARLDPDQARIVELRFFGGLSVEETAEAMAISPATVKRHWAVAKAWLLRALEGRA